MMKRKRDKKKRKVRIRSRVSSVIRGGGSSVRSLQRHPMVEGLLPPNENIDKYPDETRAGRHGY